MNIRRIARTATAVSVTAGILLGSASAASADTSYTAYDLSGDGWAETWIGDADGNGWLDVAVVDQNLDGVQDALAYDSTGNGYFDVFGLDGNQNGYFEIVAADRDDDGSIDIVFMDMNENGTEDSNEQMYPTYAVVGGTPTYDGVGGLLLTMAEMTGRATWGTGDSDHDGWNDNDDTRPYDARYR